MSKVRIVKSYRPGMIYYRVQMDIGAPGSEEWQTQDIEPIKLLAYWSAFKLRRRLRNMPANDEVIAQWDVKT